MSRQETLPRQGFGEGQGQEGLRAQESRPLQCTSFRKPLRALAEDVVPWRVEGCASGLDLQELLRHFLVPFQARVPIVETREGREKSTMLAVGMVALALATFVAMRGFVVLCDRV